MVIKKKARKELSKNQRRGNKEKKEKRKIKFCHLGGEVGKDEWIWEKENYVQRGRR